MEIWEQSRIGRAECIFIQAKSHWNVPAFFLDKPLAEAFFLAWWVKLFLRGKMPPQFLSYQLF